VISTGALRVDPYFCEIRCFIYGENGAASGGSDEIWREQGFLTTFWVIFLLSLSAQTKDCDILQLANHCVSVMLKARLEIEVNNAVSLGSQILYNKKHMGAHVEADDDWLHFCDYAAHVRSISLLHKLSIEADKENFVHYEDDRACSPAN